MEHRLSPKHWDDSLYANIVTSGVVSVLVVIGYVLIRTHFKIYSPKINATHPLSEYNGYFSWLVPTLKIRGKDLCKLVGFDAYVMLCVTMLVTKILAYVSITSVILLLLYNVSSKNPKSIFMRYSLFEGKNYGTVWFAALCSYPITFIVVFLIYEFNNWHSELRKEYFRDTISCSSYEQRQRFKQKLLHKDCRRESTNLRNVSLRTIIVRNLPSNVKTAHELYNILGIEGIELVRLVKVRDEYVQKVEDELKDVYKKIKKFAEKNPEHFRMLFHGYDTTKSLEENVKNEDGDDGNARRFYVKGKLQRIMPLEGLAPEIKCDCVDCSTCDCDCDCGCGCDEPVKGSWYLPDAEHENGNINRNMQSRRQISRELNRTSHQDFSLLMHENAQTRPERESDSTLTGFITFKTIKSAQLFLQLQLSDEQLNLVRDPAPEPEQLLYSNLKSPRRQLLCSLLSALYMLGFNLLFVYAWRIPHTLLQLHRLKSIWTGIDKQPWLSGFIDGVLGPLTYNVMNALAPIVVRQATYHSGILSHTDGEMITLISYNALCVYNNFVVFLFSRQIMRIGAGFFKGLAAEFSSSAVFFVNTVIQRAIVSNGLSVFKPQIVIKQYFQLYVGSGSLLDTMDYGIEYPSILLPFTVSLCYSILAPVCVFAGLVFAFYGYYCLKIRVMYEIDNEYEGGAGHWNTISAQLFISIFIFQIATVCQLMALGKIGPAISILPLSFVCLVLYRWRWYFVSHVKRAVVETHGEKECKYSEGPYPYGREWLEDAKVPKELSNTISFMKKNMKNRQR